MSAPECRVCSRPVGDSAPLCGECGLAIVADLHQVPALLAEWDITRAGLARMTSGHVGGRSAEAPLPVRPARGRGTVLEGDRARRRLVTAITTWTRVISQEHRLQVDLDDPYLIEVATELRGPVVADRSAAALPPALPDATARAAAWLALHPDLLRANDYAEQIYSDVIGAARAVEVFIDRRVERRYLGACEAVLDRQGLVCGHPLRAVVEDNGRVATWVRCGRCRTQYEVAQIEAAARAAAEQQLYTVADLVRVTAAIGAPIPKRTLYHWAHKSRRLEPRGWQHIENDGRARITDHRISAADVAVYRLGDALALALRQNQKGNPAA
ncbi:hypothetical protein [Nocardia puris]|uniref:Uncharacterized protein n=1 Tax=Nocardia puris TaxID=208602 RepID=A0A366DAH1_9NOCA|nr:hypothetical protein [Nocardia puris]RBO87052.1 hypothetical protein DFR74_112232 [Nocardia puris]